MGNGLLYGWQLSWRESGHFFAQTVRHFSLQLPELLK
jgi:hypothetical protein